MFEINMKNLPHILLVAGFFLLVTGCGSSYILGLQSDHEEVNKRMVDVSDTYKQLETNVKIFDEERDILYKSTLSDTYYEIFYTNDKGIKNSISNYEAMVDEIYKKVATLDELCKTYYSNKDINNKCSSYKKIYEKVHNVFVGDIVSYNKKVNLYNMDNKNKLKFYNSTKAYIDYNKDNLYDGK